MGIRLVVLSWWTPSFIIRKELDHISKLTTAALQSLLESCEPKAHSKIFSENVQNSANVKKKRVAMAKEHNALVEALVATYGRDEAVKLGRETLFELGKALGRETRGKLGMENSPGDLVRAAKILYRVLGINFDVEWEGETKATLDVNHCALAEVYSELTCMILSATDEGFISGLDSNVRMKFKERMTSGCPKCKANIDVNQKETKK